MPVPDQWSGETTTELDHDKYKLWQEAKAAVKAWQEEADRLMGELIGSLNDHDATAGTVDGQKVVGYRPKRQYAVKRLEEDYPDLVMHFQVPKITTVTNMEAFAVSHPEIADRYRVREFRELGG